MIDGGLIAGYLAVAVARGADRFVSNKIDSFLNALATRVASKMGHRPAADLRADPTDVQVQDRIAHAIEKRSRNDARFARDLAALQERLDREGGRQLVQQMWNGSFTNVRHSNIIQAPVAGDVAVGNINKTWIDAPHMADYSRAPGWVKLFTWVGALICLVGFGIIGASIFGFISGAAEQFDSGGVPEPTGFGAKFKYIAIGFGVFFAGLIVASIANLGKSTSRPRPRR